MEIVIAVLALAVMVKLSHKPTPVAKPVRKNARFGAGQQVNFPVGQSWDINRFEVYDLNDGEQFQMALS